MNQYFGKYKGTVVNNVDPLRRGRLQVNVPEIHEGGRLSWALPCVPYAGRDVGFIAIPPAGAFIWVEFERGDTDLPIWTGCFWGENETAPEGGLPDVKLIKTSTATIRLSDVPGDSSITIETSDHKMIVISSAGIEINNGQNASIKLSGAQVSINGNALEVT